MSRLIMSWLQRGWVIALEKRIENDRSGLDDELEFARPL